MRLFCRAFASVASVLAAAFIFAVPVAAQWRYYDGYNSYSSSEDYPPFPGGGDPYEPQPQPPVANPYAPPPGAEAAPNPYAPPPVERGYGDDSDISGPPPRSLGSGPVDGSELDAEAAASPRTAQIVTNPTGQPPGTIVIDTKTRRLYYVLRDGSAIEYGVGVGREGFAWKGTAYVGRKAEWPRWIPPKDMLRRRPDLPQEMDGGMRNPLGARALYLFKGKKDTLFRIHGTNEPDTIGKAVSSGCIRMMNADVMDLYRRVAIGTKVVVL